MGTEGGTERVEVDLPARLNLLGNPSDANEGDYGVVSMAIDLRAELRVEPAPGRLLDLGGEPIPLPDALPAPARGPGRLAIAALNGLVRHSAEARARLAGRGFALRFRTRVPRGSGMAGSSLFVLAVTAGLREWLDLDRREVHPYRVAEWAGWAEHNEAGVDGGYIDFYTPLFGGLLYVDFRGKLLHPEEGEGPFATVERLDPLVGELPVVVAYTGVEHDSGNVHGPMRARYLEEHARGEGPLLDVMRAVGDCGWRGKQALLAGDLRRVGELFDENHALVDRMMRICGFEDGSGELNNRLIAAARGAGALGAKLAGAGGGGSIVALAAPGEAGAVEGALQAALDEAAADSGRTYRPRLSREGLRTRRL